MESINHIRNFIPSNERINLILEIQLMKSGGRKRRNLSSASLKNISIHSFNEDAPLIHSYEKSPRSKDNVKANNGWISSAQFLCAIALMMILIASAIGLYAFRHNKHDQIHEDFPHGDKQEIDVMEELTDAIDDDV